MVIIYNYHHSISHWIWYNDHDDNDTWWWWLNVHHGWLWSNSWSWWSLWQWEITIAIILSRHLQTSVQIDRWVPSKGRVRSLCKPLQGVSCKQPRHLWPSTTFPPASASQLRASLCQDLVQLRFGRLQFSGRLPKWRDLGITVEPMNHIWLVFPLFPHLPTISSGTTSLVVQRDC